MRLGSVYAIQNTVTSRQYIGQTVAGVLTRWCNHRQRLNAGLHSTKPLQSDWNETGEAAFVVVTLEAKIDPPRLGERELFWMKAALAAGIELYNKVTGETCRWCGATLEITPNTNSRRQFCTYPAACWRYAKRFRDRRRSTARPDAPREGS